MSQAKNKSLEGELKLHLLQIHIPQALLIRMYEAMGKTLMFNKSRFITCALEEFIQKCLSKAESK